MEKATGITSELHRKISKDSHPKRELSSLHPV